MQHLDGFCNSVWLVWESFGIVVGGLWSRKGGQTHKQLHLAVGVAQGSCGDCLVVARGMFWGSLGLSVITLVSFCSVALGIV